MSHCLLLLLLAVSVRGYYSVPGMLYPGEQDKRDGASDGMFYVIVPVDQGMETFAQPHPDEMRQSYDAQMFEKRYLVNRHKPRMGRRSVPTADPLWTAFIRGVVRGRRLAMEPAPEEGWQGDWQKRLQHRTGGRILL